jgi:hypothetical protein
MKRLFRSHAHVVTALWAIGWALFFVRETIKWGAVVSAAPLWIALGLVFVLLAILPWRWEGQGGVLLYICGIGLLVAYHIWAPRQMNRGFLVLIELLLALPPMLTGLVFLSRGAKSA